MRRYRKNRCCSDCDSLHSFYFDQPMMFGSIPIEIEEDYGINGYRHILNSSKLNFGANWPYNIVEAVEAYFIPRIHKI